ncbi:MAG: GAF domain-containing protein, partial [Verrucomicrobiaceae bacterium]|nr:GAF domain-containing protein [Verrucomicrobiaceae bacterium]
IEPQERFDGVTSLAKRLLGAGYVAISLIGQSRQWFLSSCGLDVSSTSRDISFCAHTILEDATLVVEDARKDERFSDNPLVTEGPMLRA